MLQRTDKELLRQLDAGVDLSKPSSKALAYLLRNPQLWPKGFVWDYTCNSGCAMGLADRVWGTHDIGLDRKQYYDAFYGGNSIFGKSYKVYGIFPKPMRRVTPTDVAKRLESYL